MQRRRRIVLAVMLMLSVLNFSRLPHNDNIRPIQFISIFLIGGLSTLLINEFVTLFRARRQ